MPIETAPTLPIAQADRPIVLLPAMSNRHGLIAGATGTGKTVTLKVMAERFAAIGVPVFLADVKGDLTGIALAGSPSPQLQERLDILHIEAPRFTGFPTQFWDVYGERGAAVRATVSSMGPLLLGQALELNETQADVLAVTFKIADDAGLLLTDLKDLRAMLAHVSEHAKEYAANYGSVSGASVGAIQRGLTALEAQGAAAFFGEPEFDLNDFMRLEPATGYGTVNVLAAAKLMRSPRLYATFLLWLLSELFELLPEVGDLPQPKLVFFFDEAHLLFNGAPAALLRQVERVVRLIRSKGVGVFFITQNPTDIPDTVLGQLGNRVQHALRAYTPKDQAAVQAAAQTYRGTPGLDVARAVQELQVGEALISFLQEDGSPAPVSRAMVLPPASRFGPAPDAELRALIEASPAALKYRDAIDPVSAYETLQQQAAVGGPDGSPDVGVRERPAGRSEAGKLASSFAQSALRSVGSQVGRELVRGLLGGLFGASRRRR